MGCVLMGPVGLGLLLAMIDNSFPPSSFANSPANCDFSHTWPRLESPTLCLGDQDIGNQLSRDRRIDTI
jgi:hypothetical protein